jgi:hypothetical protein
MSANPTTDPRSSESNDPSNGPTSGSQLRSFDSVPSPGPFSSRELIRDLGDGLVLRRATPADTEALSRFNAIVHAEAPAGLDRQVEHWTTDLTNGSHPTMRARDFLIVEDTRAHCIASTLSLLSHRFRYGDVEFPAGQPELVGTHPDYRRRGLIDAQMEVVHRWSEERGQLVQVIDGIPWYYRQFGYEMALEHSATRVAYAPQLAAVSLSAGVSDYRVREARESDLAFLGACHAADAERLLLHCVRDEAFLRYELSGRNPLSVPKRLHKIVEDSLGRSVAAFSHHPALWQDLLYTEFVQPAEGVAWQDISEVYLQELDRAGRALAARDGGTFRGVGFDLGSQHPLHNAIPDLLSQKRTPYAWYVRVPDIVAFLSRVSPVLERNLAESDLARQTATLDISLYRQGVRIVLESGRVAAVESWRPSTACFGDVAFPDLTFLQLVFGFRSLDELRRSFPDCLVERDASAAIVSALFPQRVSNLTTTS